MKRSFITGLCASALLFGSCAGEFGPNGGDTGRPVPANTLRFSVEVQPLSRQMAATRATMPSEPGESEISSLFLLFFDPQDDFSGRFVDYVEIQDIDNAELEKWDIDMTGSQVVVNAPYHVLALANVLDDGERYLNGVDFPTQVLQWAGMTELQVMSGATAWTQAGYPVEPDLLLMSGRVEKGEDVFEITVPLTRNQARFDVFNNQKEQYDLVSVQIRNAYASTSIWNTWELDYSDEIARIPDYYTYTNAEDTTDGTDGEGPLMKDIAGYLYAFENQVTLPVQNDALTTCLVVGLSDRATKETTYYRTNIAPVDSPQVLKRNNVYRLTINNVGGPGAASADEAYDAPDQNDLDYTINYWNIDGGGMIVQDGSSVLSVPVKTIRVGLDAGTTSYRIFTFTNSPNPVSPLAIRSQSYDPAFADSGLGATINGNVLTLATDAIEQGTTRTGEIVVGYAGLKATINVIQTDLTADFLEVHLPAGGLPSFAPFGGAASGQIRVEASGDWTAELFLDGFTFGSTPGATRVIQIGTDPDKEGTNDPGRADLISANKFQISTFSSNIDSEPRDAFLLVTLDKDPQNYARVIRITQDAKAGIAITPNHTVTFNGTGSGLATALPNNTDDVFTVMPGTVVSGTDDAGDPVYQFLGWSYTIEGTDADRFAVVEESTASTTDPADPAGNYITVKAAGSNTSGADYHAQLVVFLTDDQTTRATIDLVQLSEGIGFSPASVSAVAVTGGSSSDVAVQASGTQTWTATITTGGTASDGRTTVLHQAQLMTVSADGTTVAAYDAGYNGGAGYPLSTKFRVDFPKVYYPNRDIPISATVTVTVSGMTGTLTVTQDALTARPMVGYAMTGSPNYGTLGDTYNQGWDNALALIPGYTRLTGGDLNVTSINASVDYLHVVSHMAGTAGTNYNWTTVNDFIATRDAWTVIVDQDNNGIGPINNTNSPLKKADYPNSVYGTDQNARIDTRHEATKIYQFLFAHGHTPLAATDFTNTEYFYVDSYNTYMPFVADTWPASGVVLMTKQTNDSTTAASNSDNVILVIDIEHGFLWIGDSQLFYNSTYLTGHRGVFLDNLMYFIANASKYGSHFTDMLLEDGVAGAQPAPWDTESWGRDVTLEITK